MWYGKHTLLLFRLSSESLGNACLIKCFYVLRLDEKCIYVLGLEYKYFLVGTIVRRGVRVDVGVEVHAE